MQSNQLPNRPPNRPPNRWTIAIAAVIMQVCLGSVYAWSVFTKPLMALEPWTLTQVSATFTMAIACLGIGTVIGGVWQDRVGPRIVSTAAGACYGTGFLIAAWATTLHSLPGIYIGYGLFCGLGMGMGYICPVATITKWFPDKRGLMTGAAVMGFGAGALVMSPIAARLIIAIGVPTTFVTFGVVYLVLIVIAAQFYVDPPHGWRPDGWEPRTAVSKAACESDYTVKEALQTGRFWLLWVMISLNTSAGIAIMSQASPLAQQQTGVSVVEASTIVGIISIFNAAGRVFWAWVSDFIGRWQVYFHPVRDPGFFIFLAAGHAPRGLVHHFRVRHRVVLRRRLRRHAVVHRGLLRRAIHGRNLWLDFTRLGLRRDPVPVADRACAADHGHL